MPPYYRWPNWDYGNLFFQKTYVARKFQSTARQVYRCLEALHDCMPTWSPGSAPLIVLLGGGPAAEIIAIEVQVQLLCSLA